MLAAEVMAEPVESSGWTTAETVSASRLKPVTMGTAVVKTDAQRDCMMVEEGFRCPSPGAACVRLVCGDSRIDPPEQCDDNNANGLGRLQRELRARSGLGLLAARCCLQRGGMRRWDRRRLRAV